MKESSHSSNEFLTGYVVLYKSKFLAPNALKMYYIPLSICRGTLSLLQMSLEIAPYTV